MVNVICKVSLFYSPRLTSFFDLGGRRDLQGFTLLLYMFNIVLIGSYRDLQGSFYDSLSIMQYNESEHFWWHKV